MSHSPINRSPDLRRLVDDGYSITVEAGHLVMRGVPYVNSDAEVAWGIIVSALSLAGEVTTRPADHTVHFGESCPCNERGEPLSSIINSAGDRELAPGLRVSHYLSSKPPEGYVDYYDKMTTYATLISGHAQALDPDVTPRPYGVVGTAAEDGVFWYPDTASARSGIADIALTRLCGKVAIVGLGGTGSYILDLVAKTPVSEIHLFDGDRFLQHNAFRSPGAPDGSVFESNVAKSQYFCEVYSHMHKNIFSYGDVTESSVHELAGMGFVFVAVDRGQSRRFIVCKLKEFNVPFVDVGMGLYRQEDVLTGKLRVSAPRLETDDSSAGMVYGDVNDFDGEYATNIQIADLNALNAALAVTKWKRMVGFYADTRHEVVSYYDVDGNQLSNG